MIDSEADMRCGMKDFKEFLMVINDKPGGKVIKSALHYGGYG
ncbi:MAG: hypothetical protein QME63_05495 [Actinomycetota bacterium]|nr:hypothetical protein [Actinomycetota bacterium]